jgi:hypothetical protein
VRTVTVAADRASSARPRHIHRTPVLPISRTIPRALVASRRARTCCLRRVAGKGSVEGPELITVVAAMSIEQFARELRSKKKSQQWEIQISRWSGMKATQTATVKPGASVRSAVVRTPYRETSIIMTARACGQRQTSSGVGTSVSERGDCSLTRGAMTS